MYAHLKGALVALKKRDANQKKIQMPQRLLADDPSAKHLVKATTGEEIAFVHLAPHKDTEKWNPVPKSKDTSIVGYSWINLLP